MLPNSPTLGGLPPMWQLDTESLAFVHVRHEGFAEAMLGWALAHVLNAGLVVHHRVHLLVAGDKDLRLEPTAQSAIGRIGN